MAQVTSKVLWHYELGSYGGKKHFSGDFQNFVAAADMKPATIDAVLTSNGFVTPAGHVRVFDSIANEGVGNILS